MIVQHLTLKIPVEGELTIDSAELVPVFHRWIREETLAALLIDVADYRHVPDGPGVMLIGHDADYCLDHANGEYGFLYNRKTELDGENNDRYRDAFWAATQTAQLLEAEFVENTTGPLRFSRTGFELTINDRALAPNTAETFAAVQPELSAFLQTVFGHNEFSIENRTTDPRQRFSVRITTTAPVDWSVFCESVTQ